MGCIAIVFTPMLLNLDPSDWSAIGVTFKLAALVTFILLLLGIPLAWWLSRSHSCLKGIVGALVALPLVLPPTVLGFYLLLAMGPQGWLGNLTQAWGLGFLPFTFSGLVLASVCYSLPFVVQPLQNAFEAISQESLDSAATLRASPLNTFLTVVLPMAKSGILTASVMGFTHTLGEFGVILMVGGSIPDKTRVLSVQIYDYVEAMDYHKAHTLSAGMLVFSFCCLWLLYGLKRGPQRD